MSDIVIRQPTPFNRGGNLMETKAPISCGSNTFLAGSFVKRDSSQKLAAVTTGGTACVGWSPGPSTSSTQRRPDIFWREPYPMNPVGAEFLCNITDASGHVGQSEGAPQISEVVVGQAYGLYRWTSGTYNGMQAVNVDETSNTLVEVTALGPDAESADYNGLVRVRVISSKIQP